ncbi:FAD-dependent tricarballylate dehydrogenase TcuA [Salinicoccus halodurans]|uniref:Tricarballylate dehydrogenase n=1 Tax=Salinicoccus halodurans TaxID=407035 RepID=A0A0F7HMX3_9STAP|nr:FAD-dependent tricarballylate dehydrogenase TcuA [Salinicoccus halodurans]AKG74874.1 tricarballylate dehydrogenase [Salinicoccus halodurans]SFK69082.1 tricarballylate dehydrogenase [Salinicoccus halodurans]
MKDEKHFDVVVVGTGNAALSAAVSASEKGAKVLMLEKGPEHKRGGNSFFTDGAIRFAYNDLAGIKRIVDDLSEAEASKIEMPEYDIKAFHEDLMKVTKRKSKPELAEHLVSKSYETILWMKEQGVKFIMNENQFFEKDGTKTFWGGLPVKTDNKGIGLVEALFEKAKANGVEIWYESPAVKLEKKNGEISGVQVKQSNGVSVVVPAKSVVLACGGFEADKKKRMEYLGDEWEEAVVRGSEYNTGDGITMALEAGAVRAGQYDGCHAHTTDYNAPRVGDYSKPGDIYKKSSYPLGLIVNTEGKRFVDEGADFRNYTYAKYGKETLKQPDHKAFQLYDSRVRPMLRVEYDLEEATVFKADALEELAVKMGVPKEVFLKTISQYNDAVQDGEYNPSIKDGKSTQGISPEKTNWALKFDKAPFYAYPVTCGITFTFGAVKVNDKAEVLDDSEQPVKGLYAAGEMVGELFYHNYPGGSGLMSGSVFGRTAGMSAVESIRDKTLN